MSASPRGVVGRRVAASALLVTLMPTGTVGVFDGLPLDGVAEAAVLAVLALALLAPPGRHATWLAARRGLWLAVVVAAVVPRLLLLGLGTQEGFAACYRPALQTPSGPCARSWDNPFRFGDVTRHDRRLLFASAGDSQFPPAGLSDSTWNLGMFNDNRFNFYPWERGVRVRDRLPFAAHWTGRVAGDRTLLVTAVGEVSVAVDGRVNRLPAAYDAPVRQRVTLPPGAHRLDVRLHFDDRSRQPWMGSAPYATLTVRSEHGPVAALPPARDVRALALAADLLLMGLVAVAAGGPLRVIRPWAPVLLGSAAIALLSRRVPWIAPAAPLLLVAGLVRLREHARAALPAAALLGSLAIVLIVRHLPIPDALHHVALREAGQDWLTYESLARAILEHASPWGGEDVFVYSSGFRYVLAAVRLLFGDGELLPFLFGHTLLLWSVVAFGAHVLPTVARRWWARPEPVLGAAALWFAFDLLASDVVDDAVAYPLSEWPTWAALFAVLLAWCTDAHTRTRVLAAGLAAVVFTIRSDQSPAMVFLVGLLLWAAWRAGAPRRALTAMALVPLTIALLPAAHNLAYGDALVFLPQTPRLAVNFPLPPADLLRLGQDPEVREVARSQAAGVLYLMPHSDEEVEVDVLRPVRALQALWLATAGLVLWRRRRDERWPPLAIGALLPVVYLLPHLFVQVYVYYPRHVVAGYLAVCGAVLVSLSRRDVIEHTPRPTTTGVVPPVEEAAAPVQSPG